MSDWYRDLVQQLNRRMDGEISKGEYEEEKNAIIENWKKNGITQKTLEYWNNMIKLRKAELQILWGKDSSWQQDFEKNLKDHEKSQEAREAYEEMKDKVHQQKKEREIFYEEWEMTFEMMAAIEYRAELRDELQKLHNLQNAALPSPEPSELSELSAGGDGGGAGALGAVSKAGHDTTISSSSSSSDEDSDDD